MEPQNRNLSAYLYLILGVGALLLGPMVINSIWPPPKKPVKLTEPESVALIAGSPAVGFPLVFDPVEHQAAKAKLEPTLALLSGLAGPTDLAGALVTIVKAEKKDPAIKPVAAPKEPAELIAAGHGEKPFNLQVLFNTQGGAVQQVVITSFQQADRVGLGVKLPDGKPKPLHLIPGVWVPRAATLRDQKDVAIPELKPGKIELQDYELEAASYVLYHYEKDNDERPVETLGKRIWKVAKNEQVDENTHVVAFETTLDAPHFVKITKTYTLKRSEYHIGFQLELTPLQKAGEKKETAFRYQISGPRGLPIEGEWYTTLYRQGIVGWQDARGNASRILEDPREVRHVSGSEQHKSSDTKPVRYAGVLLQYFASILAVDPDVASGQKANILEYVRVTPEGRTYNDPKTGDKSFLDDLTIRAVSKPIDLKETTTHSFVLYQGPAKVRLLKQLKGEEAIAEETVDRYLDTFALRTLTDSPMPNAFGRFAHFIFWTDLVIFFTNLVHTMLGFLSSFIPWLGVSIIIITLIVRGILFPFSRRQSLNAKIMQEKTARLAPEIKKLTEKYGSDFSKLNQEKMKLYKEHGINPAAAMGGCLLLFAQMPVFMGLYYALQESIFFRLDSFLWFPNLAAPDMLFFWSEKIPFISAPDSLGGMIYLGPFFNLLPLIAVALMMYTQSKMIPQSDDPQVEMQRKTMKIMMFMMAFFFYKVAAGLCIYFIMSSLWGMFERRLLKNVPIPTGKEPKVVDKDKPKGWLGRKLDKYKVQMEKIMEEAQKQQQLQKQLPKKKKR